MANQFHEPGQPRGHRMRWIFSRNSNPVQRHLARTRLRETIMFVTLGASQKSTPVSPYSLERSAFSVRRDSNSSSPRLTRLRNCKISSSRNRACVTHQPPLGSPGRFHHQRLRYGVSHGPPANHRPDEVATQYAELLSWAHGKTPSRLALIAPTQ